MNLHKMIEICLKDYNMHTFIMINVLICINNYVITCINSMLSDSTMKVSINKLMQHPSHESNDVCAIDIYEDPDITSCIKETMAAIEDGSIEEPEDDLFPSCEMEPELKP